MFNKRKTSNKSTKKAKTDIPVTIKTHKDKNGGHPHIIVDNIDDKHVSVGLSTSKTRKRIKKQKISSVLLRQRRHYICGLLPPARANGTKREAIWYSELYLSLVDRNFYVHGGDELRLI